jgi:virginiamycin A acetyltransferase
MTTYFLRKNLEKKHSKEDLVSKGPITIGHDVWIGTHCVILSGAEIGTGAVIAANSVVTGAIPPYAIAAGTPAKVIRYRFDEKTINELLESRWWDKDEAEVIEHYHAFAQKAGKGE